VENETENIKNRLNKVKNMINVYENFKKEMEVLSKEVAIDISSELFESLTIHRNLGAYLNFLRIELAKSRGE